MDTLYQFLVESGQSVIAAFAGLLWPAVAFLCLGLLVKGRSLFSDIRRALPETGLNIKIMLFNLIFTAPLLVLVASFLSAFWTSTGLVLFTADDWTGWPAAVIILLAVTIGDFVGYWRHRFEHTSFLWPAHAVHHSDTELTWLSLERFHPINRVTTLAIDSSALLILGLPPYAVIANALVRHYYGYFIHADLPWTYGWLNRIFVSPAMHRWHHSADEVAHDTNFATVFGLWDWAFGTHYVPGPCDGPLGVADDMKPTLAGQLSYAFSPRAYSRVFGKSARPTEPAE